MKGWIALDIDGTLTQDKYHIPDEVRDFLKELSSSWKILIVTGRTFSFASHAVSAFDFPFYFSAQNGSFCVEMPSENLIYKQYIPKNQLPEIERIYGDLPGDLLVYSGYELGDFCYYRPARFNDLQLSYIQDLQTREKEKWQAVRSFEEIDIDSSPYIKCFGPYDQMEILKDRLDKIHHFETAFVRDPFDRHTHLIQITGENVNKGLAVKKLTEKWERGKRVIAAGDDRNDLPLLASADVKIAMDNGADELKEIADIIAPPVNQHGIITALKQVVVSS